VVLAEKLAAAIKLLQQNAFLQRRIINEEFGYDLVILAILHGTRVNLTS
jgi:hypothetical protein